MEDVRIKEFATPIIGDGSGSGYGNGNGNGYGDGYGSGNGNGNGNGNGYGYGNGNGNGYGYGDGSGYGDGYGSGDGNGYGDGYGDGDGSGIKSINGQTVYIIDSTPTLIDRVRGNVAKGKILQSGLTLTPCYIVKQSNVFAHGKTLREAQEALAAKLFEDMPEDERIAAFMECHEYDKVYPNKDFFEWHNKLTGSCLAGREAWVKDRGLSVEDSITTREFIELTKDSYGATTIRKLKAKYEELLEAGT